MGKSRKIGGLTKSERIFTREYAKTENVKIASQKAYPNATPKSQIEIGSRNLNNPHIKNAIIKALDKAGLNEDFIADSIKKNMPLEAYGKNANATTINKSLEMLIKVREPIKQSQSKSLHLHLLKDLDVLSNQELLDKRIKINTYFNNIMKNK
jgi:phage terminase small subunit